MFANAECCVALITTHASVARMLNHQLLQADFAVLPMDDVAAVISSLRRLRVQGLVLEHDAVHTRHWLAALDLHAALPAAVAVVGTDREEGMELLARGATDYIELHATHTELGPRMRARLSAGRSPSSAGRAIAGRAYQVDATRHVLRSGRRSVQLTAREFALVQILFASAGEVVGTQSIVSHVWGTEGAAGHRTLEQQASRLRRKLTDVGFGGIRIRAVGGIGYRLDVEHEASRAVVDTPSRPFRRSEMPAFV